MKTNWKLGMLTSFAVLAASQASADLIVNGGFESGNQDFTTGYTYTTVANGLFTAGTQPEPSGQGEGKYAIGNNPQFYHSLFTSTGPHSGNNMMIVNGSTVAGKTVWNQNIPLVPGQTYTFSAWFMNVYPANPAQLQITIGGVNFSPPPFQIPNSGWQQFTRTFTASANGGAILDVNVLASGNDFAMDDLSLVAVPEPTTLIAGALLLLPFAASTLRVLRKNQKA
jgi:hypothetical protein